MFWTKRGELSLLVSAGCGILTKSLRPRCPTSGTACRTSRLRYRQRYVDLAIRSEVREVFVKRSQHRRAGSASYLDQPAASSRSRPR
jgi:lysyl-tRNA synthetase class II